MSQFKYDDATHTYTLGTLRLPYVSEILLPLRDFSGIPPERLEEARRIGKVVHKFTEQFDKRVLDVSQVPAGLLGYILAWKKFRDWSGVEIREIEIPAYHPKFLYGCTVDRVVLWRRRCAVVEIKTTEKISKVDALQTAAQAEIWKASARYTVRLKEDGTYELQPWEDKTDFGVFLSQLNVFNFMRKAK